MSRTKVKIPFLYPVDVVVRGSVRRVAVLGSTPPVEIRFDERSMSVRKMFWSRGASLSVRLIENGGRHHSRIRLPVKEHLAIHPELHRSSYVLAETVGGDIFAGEARHAGALRISTEDVLERMEIVRSYREAIAARAEIYGASIVETPTRSAKAWAATEFDTVLREVVVARNQTLKDEDKGSGHVVEILRGWRVHDFTSSTSASVPFHPRILRPDGLADPDFVYAKGAEDRTDGRRVDGRFPEASANLHQMLLCARQACLVASMTGSPSSSEEETLARLDAVAAEYADTLSPPPSTETTLGLLRSFSENVLDGGSRFAAQVRTSSCVAEDMKWFDAYWKRRGAMLHASEQLVEDVPAPGTDIDDAALSLGLGV